MKRLVKTLAEMNPKAAWEWVLTHPKDKARIVLGIIESLTRSNPLAALTAARGLEDENLRLQSMMKLFSTWASVDSKGALKGIEQETDPKIRDAALKEVLSTWFMTEPFAAAEHAARIGNADAMSSARFFAETATPEELERMLNILPIGKGKDEFTLGFASIERRRGLDKAGVEY